jgi:hypothetical protein
VFVILAVTTDAEFAIRLEFLLEHAAEYVSVVRRPRLADPVLERVADQVDALRSV